MRKILHIWEIAGIAYTLTKYLNRIGYNCDVISSDKNDPNNLNKKHINYPKPIQAGVIIKEARKYDLLHIHFHDELLPILRDFYPLKPIVMHYHGTDVRGKDRSKYHILADAILYSTRNLKPYLPDWAIYQPSPVDAEIWHKEPSTNIIDAGLYFRYNADDIAKQITDQHQIKLVTKERNLPYFSLPQTLREYRYFVSTKRDDKGRQLVTNPDDTGSLTELQALACGSTVLRINCIRYGLPYEHDAEVVANKTAQLYEELIK